MFSSNQKTEPDSSQQFYKGNSIDKITLWLIRLACVFIIIFFSVILLGVPILLTIAKTQYTNFLLGIKDLIKSYLEIYLT